jgi:hypothetical protein
LSQPGIVIVRNRRELRQFIQLPAKLFAADQCFVPPLERERRDALSSDRNPFFGQSGAQLFLAMRGDRVVGRISAQLSRGGRASQTGHFGLLAAQDDPAVFAALFEAAESWLREQGCTVAQGPFGLSLREEPGLLIKGFNTPPMLFMAHDPPYARYRIEELGYTKARDFVAALYDVRRELPLAARRLLGRKSNLLRVRRFDMNNCAAEFELVADLINDSCSGQWGFEPPTSAERGHMALWLRKLMAPELTAIVELRGQPVGFGLVLQNLNEAIRDFRGKMSPLHAAKLMWRLRRGTGTGRVPLIGIRRNARAGLLGGLIPFLIVDSLRQGAMARGMGELEFSLIPEDNRPMCRLIRSLGADPYKAYRLYQRSLA